jgi:hypothetical protein
LGDQAQAFSPSALCSEQLRGLDSSLPVKQGASSSPGITASAYGGAFLLPAHSSDPSASSPMRQQLLHSSSCVEGCAVMTTGWRFLFPTRPQPLHYVSQHLPSTRSTGSLTACLYTYVIHGGPQGRVSGLCGGGLQPLATTVPRPLLTYTKTSLRYHGS